MNNTYFLCNRLSLFCHLLEFYIKKIRIEAENSSLKAVD